VKGSAHAGRTGTESKMAKLITTKLLALCVAASTLAPAYAAAGPGLAYGHDDTSYPDDSAAAAPTTPAPPVARAAAPAATLDATADGTGAGVLQGAAVVRLVCHQAAADATEAP
jgi:hypothetical protein